MKAMVLNKTGGPEVFEQTEIPKPETKPGYVLVKVAASSLNPLETKIRSGLTPAIIPPFPAVLNADFAGVVEDVGEGVSRFKKGDQVFGFVGGVKGECGALAQYTLVDQDLMSLKPANTDYETAAMYPLVSITAWRAIMEKSEIKPGYKVLIHGAAGGVGHMAVQLAKLQGAIVYATVSGSRKAEIARKFGADYTINYKESEVEQYVAENTNGKGFDVVFDTIGGNNLLNSFKAVKIDGLVCTTNTRVSLDLAMMHSKAIGLKAIFIVLPVLTGSNRHEIGDILNQVKNLVEEEKISILKDSSSFKFSEIGKAHEYYESGKAAGKISLVNDLNG
ncbi:MAG: zinc-dependent alcohol dehydrogenase family protein [Sedimentibacter sp.]|uniref:zinc-dependent alcohol dehydrogenase family protein n=1 Tax=Sedimentibacter sp. TaxID=1960295 RepID=UPI003158D5F9